MIDCSIILIKFPTNPILAGQAIKVWFTSQRTVFGKLQKKKSGQARKDPTFRQQWVVDNFAFLKSHLVVRAATRTMGDSSTLVEEWLHHPGLESERVIPNQEVRHRSVIIS